MNTTYTKEHRSSTQVASGNKAKDLVTFGRSLGWDFPVLWNGPMPARPSHQNNWLIVPAHLDTTPIPDHAQRKMNAILSSGIQLRGWVIIHEAPRLLTDTPKDEPLESFKIPGAWKNKAKSTLKVTGSILGTLALAAGSVALGIAALTLLLPGVLIAGALMLDPILVAVIEDGFWVEIDRWDV